MARQGLIQKTFRYEGKRYYVTGKTEVEALVNKELKLKELQQQTRVIRNSILVKDWAIYCAETYKSHLAPKSYKNYVSRLQNSIIKYLGTMQVKQVRPLHCQEMMNKLSGKSDYIIKQAYQALKFIFDRAVQNDLIAKSPVVGITLPKGTKSTRRSLTPREQSVFLSLADGYRIFELIYYTGARPAEAAGIQGFDVTLMEGNPVVHIRGTKTENSDRYVPIPFEFYDKIKHTEPFAYVAVNQYGNQYNEQGIKRAWHSLCRKMNIAMGCRVYRNQLIPPYPLSEDLVPYCLRHTFCTNLQKKGIDIRTAQYLMGHADIKMTANIYTHADEETIKMAAEKINAVNISGTAGGTAVCNH